MKRAISMASLAAVVCLAGGCQRSSKKAVGARPTKEAGHAEEKREHEHGHGDDHGSKVVYDAGLRERLRSRGCEHKAKILECAECRYEVGAVQLRKGAKDLIRTGRVTLGTKRGKLQLTGEVNFDEKRVVHISPRIEGVARRVFVTTGDRVRAGAALFEMDSLALGRLRSGYLQAKARLELAQKNHEREKRLFKEQISSAKEKLQTETALEESRIAIKAARDQLRLIGVSGAGLKSSTGARSGRMTLRAPRAGRVVAKHVVPGERLSPDKEVLTIADLSEVWVWANVYERDLARLLQVRAAGRLEASVTVAAFTGRTFVGAVDYVGATMEQATRTVKLRVVVPNKELLLRPGMFAEVGLALGQAGKALSVPAEAVVSDGGDRFVFVKIGPRRFLRRDVRSGEKSGDKVEIVSGLTAGEEIVVRGAFLLKSDILREKMGAGCAD